MTVQGRFESLAGTGADVRLRSTPSRRWSVSPLRHRSGRLAEPRAVPVTLCSKGRQLIQLACFLVDMSFVNRVR
jgi:hypothetical protein